MIDRIIHTDRLARNVTTMLSVLFVIAAFFGAFIVCDRMTVTHAGTFRTTNLLVDDFAQVGSNASALENPNRVLSVGGPWQNVFHVGSGMSEVFLQTLQDGPSPHPATSDVCGVVVRNQVTFDTSTGSNQACAIYGEVTSTVATGGQPLVNYAVRGNAICGAGVTNCYSFFGDHGAVRADDGAFFGPEQIAGALQQHDGDVTLNGGGSGGGGSGTTTILGNTHVSGHTLVVDSTGEFGGNLTADLSLRVNGVANLAGGTSQAYINRVTWSTETLSASGAASVGAKGLTWASGTGTNLTLADGIEDGQEKMLIVISGTGQLTPANFGPGTRYTWSAAGASTVLVWNASTSKWWPEAMVGMTLVP